MSMIEIKHLCKSFGESEILKDVNLSINKGDSIVIVGGSGCGKSTLLRCINRLNEPTSGEIWFDGVNIMEPDTDIDQIRSRIGMVYQQFNLFSDKTVLENIILAPMKVLGVSQEDAIAEARVLLKKIGLERHINSFPSSLSGGQKQRVAIARACAMHPEVMLFDEPTSALDPTMVGEVENVIRNLIQEGMTSVIVTHEMRFAKNIASKVVFLAEKGIYETGTPEEFFTNPQKPLTIDFLFRSHMVTEILKKNDYDHISLYEKLAEFIRRYSYTSDQLASLPVMMDELIDPVLNQTKKPAKECELRLICSATSEHHTLNLKFFGVGEDVYNEEFLDPIGMKILENRFEAVHSKVDAEGNCTVVLQL